MIEVEEIWNSSGARFEIHAVTGEDKTESGHHNRVVVKYWDPSGVLKVNISMTPDTSASLMKAVMKAAGKVKVSMVEE